jgi:hypothetical protein
MMCSLNATNDILPLAASHAVETGKWITAESHIHVD